MNSTRRVNWAVVLALCNLSLLAQTNQTAVDQFRPFQVTIAALSTKPLDKQYEFLLKLSGGLMQEDYAAVTDQRDLPHFGHLAEELMRQKQFGLMRELLRRREISPFNYYMLAELMAKEHDADTFAILVTNSSPAKSPSTGKGSHIEKETGDGVPEYSALSLRHYLTDDPHGVRAQTHLIELLEKNERTGVRAFAAQALGEASGVDAIKALEAATNDKGFVSSYQAGFVFVSQFAIEALKKVKKRESGK